MTDTYRTFYGHLLTEEAPRKVGEAVCPKCGTPHPLAGWAIGAPWSCIPRCRVKDCHAVLIIPERECVR